MNVNMFENSITQDNLSRLKARGFTIVGPASGRLASGKKGLGRFANATDIIGSICQVLGKNGDLAGKHIVVTAGGTQEPIDPVRCITNRSSGKMGYALGRAALRAGHEVTLITAPTALKPSAGATVVAVESAAQMSAAVKEHFPACDCLIMAAAVSDFTPVRRSKTKIKKEEGQPRPTLQLKPTADILKWAARHKSAGQTVVGFALEDRNLRANAEKKLRDKRLDMIVANSPEAIGAERSDVQVKVTGGDWMTIRGMRKLTIARRIVRLAEQVSGAVVQNAMT